MCAVTNYCSFNVDSFRNDILLSVRVSYALVCSYKPVRGTSMTVYISLTTASLLKGLKHVNIVTLHDIIHTATNLTFVFEYVVRTGNSVHVQCVSSLSVCGLQLCTLQGIIVLVCIRFLLSFAYSLPFQFPSVCIPFSNIIYLPW